MNITELFFRAASAYPDTIAIVDRKTSITYHELSDDVRKTAAYFSQKGIKEGDRVLVFVPMSIDLYRVVMALFYLGAVAVFLDEWASKQRLELCCRLADCQGFVGIFKARVFRWFSSPLRQIPINLHDRKMLDSSIPITQVTADSPALITFTTGSTGTPKAANRTHQFLKEQFDALNDEIDPQPKDVDLVTLPIVLFQNLGMGSTSVIADFDMRQPDALDPAPIVQQLVQYQVNRMTTSPFFVRKVSEYATQQRTNLPHLRKVFTGGAPVFPTDARLLLKAFPSAKSIILYGSTEAEPMSSIDAKELAITSTEETGGLAVGKPNSSTQLKIIEIIDEALPTCSPSELESMTLAEGRIGEIIVSGPHVLASYFRNDEAFRTNKIVVDGTVWHRTGDSGFLHGRDLFLTGRNKQLIKSGDSYLSPFIMEDILQHIDGVTTGTLMELDGKVTLVVETVLSEAQVTPNVGSIPYNEVMVMKHIPRDPRHNSKIDYGKLKQLLKPQP